MCAPVFRWLVFGLLWLAPHSLAAQSSQPAAGQPLLKAELSSTSCWRRSRSTRIRCCPRCSIASTYPLEVVQADRWAKANSKLKGDALAAALAKQSWDDSVKSLVSVPSVLTMMADQLEWTQKLGDAVLAQQADVMDCDPASARTRAGQRQAQIDQGADGHCQERGRQAVCRDRADVRPQRSMCHTTSPPSFTATGLIPTMRLTISHPHPAILPRVVLATGVAFAKQPTQFAMPSGETAIGAGATSMWCQIGRSASATSTVATWVHNADHRHGVKYNNADVRQKYAKTDIQAGKGARQDFRGKEGQKVLDPIAAVRPRAIAPALATATALAQEILIDQPQGTAIDRNLVPGRTRPGRRSQAVRRCKRWRPKGEPTAQREG